MHILAVCPALAVVRQRLYPDLMNVVAKVQPTCEILAMSPPETLTQFILDCTSINLPESFRIPAHNKRFLQYHLTGAMDSVMPDLDT